MTDNTLGRLVLLRHGQTTSNVIHALDTALPGADLTELGCEQAFTAGQMWNQAEGYEPRPVFIASSEALRARHTARLVARGMASMGVDVRTLSADHSAECSDRGAKLPHAIPGITEVSAGELEMLNDEASHHVYHSTVHAWAAGKLEERIPGGESGSDAIARMVAGCESVLPQLESCDVVLVIHGSIMRLFAAYLSDVAAEFAERSYVSNCRYISLRPASDFNPHEATLKAGEWTIEQWATIPGSLVPTKR